MTISPMITRGGNSAANQFTIQTSEGTYLQSYNSVVAFKSHLGTYLGPDYNYSRTTSRYVNNFLNTTSTRLKADITTGRVKVLDSLFIGSINSKTFPELFV